MIVPYALEISVVCVGIFLLMVDAFLKTDKTTIAWTGVVVLLAIFGLTFALGPMPKGVIPEGFYVLDPTSLFFKRFLLLATVLTLILSVDYSPVYQKFVPAASPQAGLGEFFTLPVFACAGMMFMVSANDFIMIFVALELVTIAFYVLVASMRKNQGSLEAGVKYLILGALSTGFLVYGITWLYGITGYTSLEGIQSVLPRVPEQYQPSVLFGLGLVLVALGFKVAAVPFQFWVPDVYQGAPTPVTAYLSVASKAAGFVVLLRVLEPFVTTPAFQVKVFGILTILAAVTLVLGNLAAMSQQNLKRLLAYSSIAHAGYLLVAVASLSAPGARVAIGFYLGGYLVMTFLAFLVLLNVAKASGGDDIRDFNGLGKRSPVLALGLLIAMLSLAGLPFTIGFLGKFFIFEAALASGQYVLVVLGAITVACGFYYYLKVVMAMYWQPAAPSATSIQVSPFGHFLIGLLVLAIILFGIFPQPLLGALTHL
ncbi:NADH-quinone oxidoreductase subunit N [Terrimicrobium sacchariphilum]|jgi:NADH-quinone oxidoreductase subunit N|uniref:NADH-quinone oxidoreductase subunit N n=1 Tax=Terrimicrobium sacchariphilum TaxID=690879 RepID=A0A146G6Y8_TERSA|nr:NADH-quinone oxidoreductase subunit N [Terrimicrobium sacchariphilum]GAT33485.1 NADH-quinone oxidoreductase subunit N [Terrimicrobium sacchariphilum]